MIAGHGHDSSVFSVWPVLYDGDDDEDEGRLQCPRDGGSCSRVLIWPWSMRARRVVLVTGVGPVHDARRPRVTTATELVRGEALTFRGPTPHSGPRRIIRVTASPCATRSCQ